MLRERARVRGFLKRGAEVVLVRSGLTRAWRAVSTREAVVLAYHNVVPAGEDAVGDTSLHIPFPLFKAQVDLLSRMHTVVSLKELLASSQAGKTRLAAITFDDAYYGALELGVGELIRRGLPATVFVSPGLLGSQGFWWDRVADPETGVVPHAFKAMAFRELGGRQKLILERAASLGLSHGPPPESCWPASEGAVDLLVQHPLVTLGSHTWSHVHLPSVSRPEAEEELRRSFAWVRDRSPSGPFFLSYPYGGHDGTLEPLLRDEGYQAGLLIRGGAMRLRELRANRWGVPRLNVPRGMSPEGLEARLSGAWPR